MNDSEHSNTGSNDRKVDMSPEAISARLEQLSQLYDLSIMLQSAKKSAAPMEVSELPALRVPRTEET